MIFNFMLLYVHRSSQFSKIKRTLPIKQMIPIPIFLFIRKMLRQMAAAGTEVPTNMSLVKTPLLSLISPMIGGPTLKLLVVYMQNMRF